MFYIVNVNCFHPVYFTDKLEQVYPVKITIDRFAVMVETTGTYGVPHQIHLNFNQIQFAQVNNLDEWLKQKKLELL